MRQPSEIMDGPAPHALGAVRVVTREGPGPDVLRMTLPPRAGDAPLLAVGTQSCGRAVLSHRGLLEPFAPGDVFVVDPAQPWELREPDVFRLHLHLLPRDWAGLPERDLTRLWGVSTQSGTGVAGLLAPVLTTVAARAPSYDRVLAHRIAGSLADLLGTLAVERTAADEGRAGPDDRAVMARTIRRFVNENLSDRALGPERVAARHGVSVRYVHKVFAGQGTTLGRWIRERRLQECRRELARPDGVGTLSFAAVARRWGFADAAHFSRSFRAAYGMSPSEWRRIRAAAADGRAGEVTGPAPGSPRHASRAGDGRTPP
ncbi:helix-turn-helix transcriptional regulator [Streptomyces sp. NPDC085946]|uniref:helix-turn-helix transcriptional regulator n=1 Tax=Streptomyces sp. NPDC085946 TaxID=3365744 RepID=UPI0037CDF59D